VTRLENKTNRVQLNLQESQHLQKKYLVIRDSLLEDRVHFESTLDQLEAEIGKQRSEILELQVSSRCRKYL
jgi:hypothetical protein